MSRLSVRLFGAVRVTLNGDPVTGFESDKARALLAYLLRLWRMRGAGESGWRASLVSPDSGQRRGFASLEDLFLFLRRQTRMLSDADSSETKVNAR